MRIKNNKGFTRIENDILEKLVTSNLSSAELKVTLLIIRKTNGFNKETDQISYSQLVKETGLSRQTISNCLTQLQLVNIIRLVKKGTSKKSSNKWKVNKKVSSWELVNRIRLVKFPIPTSQVLNTQLVNTSRHTKENTKENTKEIEALLLKYNSVYGKKLKTVAPLISNYNHWRDVYTTDEIQTALVNAHLDPFWKDKMTPQILLRKKTPQGEDVDRIGEFLSKDDAVSPEQQWIKQQREEALKQQAEFETKISPTKNEQ